MSLLQVSENRIKFKESLNKKQISFFVKALLIAGVGFGLICGIGYLFYFALDQKWIKYETFDTIYIIAFCLLFVQILISIFLTFAKKINSILMLFLYVIYIFSFGVFFSSIFFLFSGASLLMLFGITAGCFLICALIGSFMSNKAGISLFKIIMIMMPIYFIFSLVLSLVSVFVFNYEALYILYTMIGAIIIMLLNVYSFYNLTKVSQFVGLNDEIDAKEMNKMCFLVGFNIMSAITNTLLIVARILLLLRQ